jgi:hypothetical protein
MPPKATMLTRRLPPLRLLLLVVERLVERLLAAAVGSGGAA